jgi:hypothetical protein
MEIDPLTNPVTENRQIFRISKKCRVVEMPQRRPVIHAHTVKAFRSQNLISQKGMQRENAMIVLENKTTRQYHVAYSREADG